MGHVYINGGLVRRLWVSDRTPFLDHLLRLDRESRHNRFGGAVSDEFLGQYASRCFGADDVIYGFFVDGILRGAGELRPIGIGDDPKAGPRAAEAAFSVENDYRRAGVGTELMARITRAARNRRADTLFMTCLSHNQAMQGLARKFEADLRFEFDSVTGRLIGRTPTPLSLWGEAMDDAAGFATAIIDLQRRAFSNPVASAHT